MTVRLTRLRPRSLRARTILYIGAGTMLVAVVFAVATYLLARSFLLDQRVQGVQRRAAIDARLMTSRLETPGTDVPDVLARHRPAVVVGGAHPPRRRLVLLVAGRGLGLGAGRAARPGAVGSRRGTRSWTAPTARSSWSGCRCTT